MAILKFFVKWYILCQFNIGEGILQQGGGYFKNGFVGIVQS